MKSWIALLVCLVTAAVAENSTHWIYPPGIPNTFSDPPLAYNYGDTVNVSWISTFLPIHFQGPYLDLWCGSGNLKLIHIEVLANDTRVVALSNIDFKGYPLPLNCHWSIDYNASGNGSEMFIINNKDPNLSPTTWGIGSTAAPASSSSSTPSGSSALASTMTAGPMSNAASTSAATSPSTVSQTTVTATASSGSSGLSTGAKIGIALGCTVGTLVGVAASFGVAVFRRRQVARNVQSENNKGDFSKDPPTFSKPELPTNEHLPREMPLCQDTGYGLAPFELPGGRQYEELPGERLRQASLIKRPVASAHELPVAATPGSRNFELPGLPSSPRPAMS